MKKFKDFANLLENPMMNDYLSKDKMDNLGEQTRYLIKNSTSPEEKVGHNLYHKMLDGDHAYFNKKDNEVNALSIVTNNNVHRMTHKNNGSGKQIHTFMLHHAEQHGSIQSDMSNTEGSKHLWTSLVKSKPVNKSFHTLNVKTQEKVPVDANNINEVSDKIWGRHSKFNDIRMVMIHHDPI